MSKTALKTISLYEIITSNRVLLSVLLFNIITLILNYYFIKYLELLKNINPLNTSFGSIQNNLNICQSITMMTCIVILCIPRTKKIINQPITNSDAMIYLITYFSLMLKQIHVFYSKLVKPIYHQNSKEYGAVFDIISFTYWINLFAVSIILYIFLFVLLMSSFKLIEYIFNKIIKWTKTMQFRYIETSETDEKEQV
jgi:hypothetical protein